MALETKIDLRPVPIEGGAITVRDRGLLKLGQFSMVQNVKALHPGFRKRKGQVKQHSTIGATYSSSELTSAYQFKKTRNAENLYLVQSSDGDVQVLTTAPPGITTGDMGTVSLSATASPKPASWSNLNDMLVYSTTVDQHKLYPGTTSFVSKFVVYTSGGADITTLKGVLEDGIDYTEEVSDGQTSTVAVLDSLDDKDAGDGIFICTPVPAKSLTWTIPAPNGTASRVASLYYWKSDFSWTEVTGLSDGTDAGSSTTLGQTGTMSWTEPTDVVPRYLFGVMGYWYLLVIDANALDAEVEVSAVTYDASWNDLVSMWDGVMVSAPAVLVEGTSYYDTYSGASVDLDSLAAGKKIYICSPDPIEGIYFDPGSTPNVNTTMTLSSLKYWDGAAWQSVGTPVDGSASLTQPGWMVFPRKPAVPRHMEGNAIYGYWYELIYATADISADVVVSISTMPYYDIHDWGYYGQSSCAWKGRMIYTWADKWPEYVYISSVDMPQVITGMDSGIIEVGDGRPHKVTAIKNFFNNVLVFQEEKGEIGGCVTMLQGYDVPTFGKLVLSTKLGTFSQKSVDVVENVYTATATEEELNTVAFFLSRYGVVACNGVAFSIISDDIQNYFDTNSAVCINYNYLHKMWLKHDPIDHVLRIGLVTGSSTVCDVFPVYDLVSRKWYFDSRAQALAFWENVEAGSGNAPIAQLGGGTANGQLYVVNTGTQDVTTAIDTYITIEFPGYGLYVDFLQFLLTCAVQSSGNITLTTYQNGIAKDTITLPQTAERTNDIVRRHLLSLNVVDQHVSVKIQNSSTTESMTIMAVGAEIKTWLNR